MIGSLKGTVAYLTPEYCLLETAGGVGYRVFMPAAQLQKLAIGQETRVLTYTAVREDAILLYGFLNQKDYDLFALLLGVSGVGPKGAIGILSSVKPGDFYLAVQSRDIKALTKLPGIGKKTAERLILELKDKVGTLEGRAADEEFANLVEQQRGGAVEQAMEALAALGYANSEIQPVIRKIPDYGKLGRDELIRKALQIFAQR
ncbi:MAG: Holliday junction branch migration protein RuvA [Succiniclasticum sp.]|jgi:Holliday junction DNA helicase RuvA|nr:Holliday junction branch migration protein RuvA [Succiniclasticum sp.]MEE3479611.1 Holliday junction branch migration protein RuvA [Succiniclasticum sp.]